MSSDVIETPLTRLILTKRRYSWFTAGAGSPYSTFGTSSHDVHRVRRSAINAFFSKRTITSVEPLIKEKINNLCQLFAKQVGTGQAVGAHVVYFALTIDIISDYCFGSDYGCLHDPKLAEEWATGIGDAFASSSLVMHMPWILALMKSVPDWATLHLIMYQRVSRPQLLV